MSWPDWIEFSIHYANKKVKERSSKRSYNRIGSRTFNALVFLCLLGFGGLGPIIEGPIVGWIADAYGWAGPFYLMVGMSLLGSVTMLRASRIDQSIKQAQFMGTITSETAWYCFEAGTMEYCWKLDHCKRGILRLKYDGCQNSFKGNPAFYSWAGNEIQPVKISPWKASGFESAVIVCCPGYYGFPARFPLAENVCRIAAQTCSKDLWYSGY